MNSLLQDFVFTWLASDNHMHSISYHSDRKLFWFIWNYRYIWNYRTHFLFSPVVHMCFSFLSVFVIRPIQKKTECYTNLWGFKMYFLNPLKWNKNFPNNFQYTMSEAFTENGKFWGFFLLVLSLLSEILQKSPPWTKENFAVKTLLKLQ